MIPIVIDALGICKGTGRLGNKRTSRDRPDNSIIKIGQNIVQSSRDSIGLF